MVLMINENITYYIPHSKIEVFRSKKQKTIRQISGDVRGRLLLLAFLPQSDDRQIKCIGPSLTQKWSQQHTQYLRSI